MTSYINSYIVCTVCLDIHLCVCTSLCTYIHRYEYDYVCLYVCFRSIFLEIRVYGNNNTLSPTALTITIITVTTATTTTATAAAAKHTTLTTKPALVDVTKRVAAAHADSQQLCPDAAADHTRARSILSTFLLALSLSARIAPLFREPVRVCVCACARMNIKWNNQH